MATVMERPLARDSARQPEAKMEGFLAELGEISRRYGIAISDGATLYLMEPDDYARSYSTSNESDLTFL